MHRTIFISSLLLCLGLTACAGHHKGHKFPGAEQGITVVGAGKASAPPDIARTSIGVEVRSGNVEQATAEATTRMAAITQAIKQLGIADKDLRTHSFSIGFEQEPTPPTPPMPADASVRSAPGATATSVAPAPSGPRGFYRVSNMLEVTIRDLGATGRVLSAATAAGANNVWGITFEIDDQEPLKARARGQAVERAKQAAAELARLSGVKLGKLISISEAEAENRGGPVMMYARQAANEDVPIERGEVTVSYGVRVVYGVKD
jgi:uncharacterized protein